MKILVLQVKIGEGNYWNTYEENQSYKGSFDNFVNGECIPSVKKWAERCGYDYLLQTVSTFSHPEIFASKYQVYCAERLMHLYKEEYDYIIHVDSDVYASPTANLFPVKLGLNVTAWDTFPPFFEFRGIDIANYYNAGIYCVDRETGKKISQSIFNTMIPNYSKEKYQHGDQCFLNEWIISNGCNFLDKNWNCSVDYIHNMTRQQMKDIKFLHFAWKDAKEHHIKYFNTFKKNNELEIANIFWHGELTQFERVCIKSFVKQGFHTKIWSYTNIQVDGAESCDARLVLPEEHLTKYKQQHFEVKDGSKESLSSLAAFSDAFRWTLINKFGGWWFDADCYCLKSSEEFKTLRENKSFISGLQDYECPSVACGAFYANQQISAKLVGRLNSLCEIYNYEFPKWGTIGPLLISDVVQNENLLSCVLSPEKFYSIENNSVNYYINPSLKNEAKSLIVNSYVTHIWHSMLNFHNIDKNNPPENSLLKEFYDETYTNNSLPNIQVISKYDASLERYIQISHLYKKVLNRFGDVEGIGHYCRSQLPYFQIENIFKRSEEYRQTNRVK
jgi:hypothetical protein